MDKTVPFSVVFLAGGSGSRMENVVPKQFLSISHTPIALYSFGVFASMPEVQHLVVVCEPQYENLFRNHPLLNGITLAFALPGKRRQDSVFNGIQLLPDNPLVCIHDSARPFIKESLVRQVVHSANSWEAALAAVRVKSTIKVSDGAQIVVDTPGRDSLWEAQTPQVIRLELLKEGFRYAQEHHLGVTDDVSLVELLGKPVKIIEGSYDNIKVTTPEDLHAIEQLKDKYVLLQADNSL